MTFIALIGFGIGFGILCEIYEIRRDNAVERQATISPERRAQIEAEWE